jgi:hypothetical protein
MKKNTIVIFIIIAIFLVDKVFDPLSWGYVNYYGVSFNNERSKIGLLPVENRYTPEWTEKYTALEFLPDTLEKQTSFKYKRLLFSFLKIKTEVDVFKKMKNNSSELAHLYYSYDFERRNHEYTYQVYQYDSLRKAYVFDYGHNLSQFMADSILNLWNK